MLSCAPDCEPGCVEVALMTGSLALVASGFVHFE